MTMPTCDSEVFFTFSLALFMRPTCDKDRHPKEAILVQSELIKQCSIFNVSLGGRAVSAVLLSLLLVIAPCNLCRWFGVFVLLTN